jgi:ketosteroid isomerase-like protein
VSSENLDAVRRIHERWAQGDFSSVDWANPEIVFRDNALLSEHAYHGVEEMGRQWSDWLHTWKGFRSEPLEYFERGDQVVTFNRFSGSARASGLPLSEIPGAARFVFRDGKVIELQIYADRKLALRDAGIEPDAEA